MVTILDAGCLKKPSAEMNTAHLLSAAEYIEVQRLLPLLVSVELYTGDRQRRVDPIDWHPKVRHLNSPTEQ